MGNNRSRKGEAGQVLPLIALSLAALMGFAGMAVDNGYWQYTLRQQQSATDSAAIGAAQSLDAAGCPSQSTAQSAALADAASNGYANGGKAAGGGAVTVTVQNPPASGPYAGNNCAIQVQISAQQQTFFSKMFGHATMPESTQAVALLASNNNGCIYLLNSTAASSFSGGSVSAPGCSIYVNGPVTFSAPTVNAQTIGYSGSPPVVTGTTFTGGSPKQSLPIPNPCTKILGCSYLSNNPPPATSCTTLKANMNATISPGCYNTLTIGTCGTVTLLPGTYVLNGTSDFSNTSFVGNGVTFYVTANGTPPDFSTARSATISPPQSGNTAGVLYYQVPGNTAAPNLSGSTVHFSGLVYAPGALNAQFNGAQGDYTVLVFGSAKLNGSSGYTFGTPPAGSTLVQNAVLAQ